MADKLDLSNLKPANPRRARKRIGRGLGSGKGRYSGRGIKGQKSRAGSAKMRPGFEGGQMPIAMRLGKQRGPTSADAMPIGPHRTSTVPVNVRDLERFEDGVDVSPEALVSAGVIKNTRIDIKILGQGELTKRLNVSAHGFSASARAKIEAAGGTATLLRGAAQPPGRDSGPGEGARGNREVPPAESRAADESVDADPEGAAPGGEG